MLRALRKERKSKQYTDVCVIMSFSVILNDDKNLYHNHGRMNAVCLCLQKDFFLLCVGRVSERTMNLIMIKNLFFVVFVFPYYIYAIQRKRA